MKLLFCLTTTVITQLTMAQKRPLPVIDMLVNAGFCKRIMFGSDNMVWPQAIEIGIDAINKAPFLTVGQKRDILFNNAARFLRLTEKEIKDMYQ